MPEEAPNANASESFALLPGAGKTITIGPNQITYKLGGEATDGAFSIIEYLVAPNFQAPPTMHFHVNDTWAAYVLEGTLNFQIGERVVSAPAGAFLFVPKGTPFKWWNPADRPAKWLIIYQPAGFEKYFEEVNRITQSLPPGPLDMSKLMPQILPLWEKFGIGVVDAQADEKQSQ